MTKPGISTAALRGTVLAAFAAALATNAEARTRRIEVEFQATKPAPRRAPAPRPIPPRMRGASPFASYLKAFNDTHTPGQLYQRLGPVTSIEWKSWYASTHRRVPLHRTSVEFLQSEVFLVRTPGTMSLLNTTRMDEGVLVISRRPFPFTRDEKFNDIVARLSRIDVRQRYESRLPFLKLFELLWHAPLSWADSPTESASRIAPMMALIDIARARVNCLDILEEVPHRGPASAPPVTADCRRALAEQRDLSDPGRGEPAIPVLPSRRLIAETGAEPSPLAGPGMKAPARAPLSRAPAAHVEAPVIYEGAGRD